MPNINDDDVYIYSPSKKKILHHIGKIKGFTMPQDLPNHRDVKGTLDHHKKTHSDATAAKGMHMKNDIKEQKTGDMDDMTYNAPASKSSPDRDAKSLKSLLKKFKMDTKANTVPVPKLGVKEEAEPIEELSKGVVNRYHARAKIALQNLDKQTKDIKNLTPGQSTQLANRIVGTKRAKNRGSVVEDTVVVDEGIMDNLRKLTGTDQASVADKASKAFRARKQAAAVKQTGSDTIKATKTSPKSPVVAGQPRSAAAAGRAAERDWLHHMNEEMIAEGNGGKYDELHKDMYKHTFLQHNYDMASMHACPTDVHSAPLNAVRAKISNEHGPQALTHVRQFSYAHINAGDHDFETNIGRPHRKAAEHASKAYKAGMKKMHEAVEAIEELSKGTLKSYLEKNKAGKAENNAKAKAGDEKARNRQMTRAHGAGAATLRIKEEAEQVDELSKKTLGSYIPKAAMDLSVTQYARGTEDGGTLKRSPNGKAIKRLVGISKASRKLAKEDTDMLSFKQYRDQYVIVEEVEIVAEAMISVSDFHDKADAMDKKEHGRVLHKHYDHDKQKAVIRHESPDGERREYHYHEKGVRVQRLAPRKKYVHNETEAEKSETFKERLKGYAKLGASHEVDADGEKTKAASHTDAALKMTKAKADAGHQWAKDRMAHYEKHGEFPGKRDHRRLKPKMGEGEARTAIAHAMQKATDAKKEGFEYAEEAIMEMRRDDMTRAIRAYHDHITKGKDAKAASHITAIAVKHGPEAAHHVKTGAYSIEHDDSAYARKQVAQSAAMAAAASRKHRLIKTEPTPAALNLKAALKSSAAQSHTGRMAEEVEQIEELSTGTLTSYASKATADIHSKLKAKVKPGTIGKSYRDITKRADGITKARKMVTTREGVEHVVEFTKKSGGGDGHDPHNYEHFKDRMDELGPDHDPHARGIHAHMSKHLPIHKWADHAHSVMKSEKTGSPRWVAAYAVASQEDVVHHDGKRPS